MSELKKKSRRTIAFALKRLGSKGAYTAPRSIAEWKLVDRLVVELKLDNKRTIFLSAAGSEYFKSVVQTIYEADLYEGDADYGDIWSACKIVIECLLSQGQLPESEDEFIRLISDEIGRKVRNFTYAIAIHGVELKDIETLQLGSILLARSPLPFMATAGISTERPDVINTVEAMSRYKWLIGPARGTQRVSEKRFRALAELACGMLAVSAAVMCSIGAEPFSIGLVHSPEQSHRRAAWLSWTDDSADPITHSKSRGSQLFAIDSGLSEHLATVSTFQKAFEIFESDTPTELENRICRSVYWFSEAHRDPRPVMKLVKYWSCIEVFFTANDKKITSTVASGIATVLVFGGFKFASTDEYFELKKRAASLYGQRSGAVHHGSHEHVREDDVAELSLIAARLIINMLSFVELGYKTVSDVKEQATRLDSAMQRGKMNSQLA